MIAATSPDWPYGEPKNVVTPGDSTGTPWIVETAKDIMGFQQALLIRSGITPTGTPETADSSQYYDALTTLFSRTVSTTTAIKTSKLPNVAGVQTAGFLAVSDGGGALWESTGGTGTPGTDDFAAGKIYDADGKEFAIIPGPIRKCPHPGYGPDRSASNRPATLYGLRRPTMFPATAHIPGHRPK
jgi:hypothetical protein